MPPLPIAVSCKLDIAHSELYFGKEPSLAEQLI
jgi:hypothetical protein